MKLLAVLCLLALGWWTLGIEGGKDGLSYDYYYKTCPQAEIIVANLMKVLVMKDITVPARIIRMHFHDCFVRGCDGSILINSTPGNKAEKDAAPNNPSIRGFEIIDLLKEALEYNCPGVVSCADILAYAAREAVYLSGEFKHYTVRGGRRDGKISRELDALLNLIAPSAEVKTLIQGYANKGLSLVDMVALSGAHSIGVSHCSSIDGRQINFNNTGMPDPTLDYHLAATLRTECMSVNGDDPIVFMDRFTPIILDNKYYVGLLQNKGLFTSDQTLLTNKLTRKEVIVNAAQPSTWARKFETAMINMGEIEVLTGEEGEIRKVCSRVNY